MLRYRGICVVGLALSLAGCAGTQQGLVAQSPAKENVASRLLSWRGRPATATVDKTDDASVGSSAPTDAKMARASTATTTTTTTTTDSATDRAPSAARRDQVAGRVSRFFPLFNRGDNNNTQAKAEFVAPAERDVWAESARRGLQARAERARRQERAAGEDDGESSVLPVAMDVGPSGTSVRPQAVTATVRPRPANPATVGGGSEADPNANAATLPGPIEPVSGSRVEQTSAQAVAVPDTPPAPNRTATEPAPAPPGATPPSPASAPEPATRPATATPAAEAPAPSEPAKATETEPAKATETEPAKATETEPAASPTPEPQAVPQASPQAPAAPLVPSAAPAAPAKAAPVVAPTAQASPQAPVACKGHCDQCKGKKKCWLLQHLAALIGHAPKPHTHGHKPVAKTPPAPPLPSKQMPAQPAAPAKAPASAAGHGPKRRGLAERLRRIRPLDCFSRPPTTWTPARRLTTT